MLEFNSLSFVWLQVTTFLLLLLQLKKTVAIRLQERYMSSYFTMLKNTMTQKILSLSVFLLLATFAKAQDQQAPEGAQPDLPGMLLFDYGLNLTFNNPDDFDISIIRSRSIGFHYLYPLSLGESGNFSFHPGIGVSSHNYTFDNNVTLSITDSTAIVDLDNNLYPGVDKTKLSVHYVNIPLEFRYFAQEGYRGFTAAVGGVIGRRLLSFTKIKFDNNQYDKFRRDFNINPWRYGAYVRVGFRGIMLSGKYMVSELFQEGEGPTVNTMTVGLTLSLF